MPAFTHSLLAILAAMALSGCSEKPPRADPERVDSYNEAPQNQLQQRAQTQGENERMSE